MKFTTLVSAALALASGIIAAPVGLAARQYFALTSSDYATSVGTPMTITWSGASGAVTVNLKSGSAENLETIGIIAAGVWGSSAFWTPTTSGSYAFEIIDGSGNVNYSPHFWVGA